MTRAHRCFLRGFDLFFSSTSLLLLAPILATCAVVVRSSSPGPALYRQSRVGRRGALFFLYKFRSMRAEAGPEITSADDQRITRVGRWLRRRRLDELPQLWNILRGDMSFVGPRPEVPRFVAHFGPHRDLLLSVRPGLTDPATLDSLAEEEKLRAIDDPERYYIEKLLPIKLERSASYLHSRSLATDLSLLIRSAWALATTSHQQGKKT